MYNCAVLKYANSPQRVLFDVLEGCLTFLNSRLFYNTDLYYNTSNRTATPRERKFLRNLGGFFFGISCIKLIL